MIIRAAHLEDAPGIAHVHVDSWRTTYKGIMPDKTLANLSYEQRTQQWVTRLSKPHRETFIPVAEDGQIVGFVSGGPVRSEQEALYKSELYAIYILSTATVSESLDKALLLHVQLSNCSPSSIVMSVVSQC
jgi:L-amino acid N-acyltransferase YncA